MHEQWERLIWPVIADLDHRAVLELAAGHGRNSARLLETAGSLVLVDINPSCLDACRARFGDDHPRVRYLSTDGYSLRGVDDQSITLVYCFDAMVHFAPDVVAAYLPEICRVLVPGGHAFLHHSNHAVARDADFRDAPHWRNYMSMEEMARLAEAAGLTVTWSKAIDWGRGEDRCENLDGLSLLRRDADVAPS
jgi:ubiquinone/menaquinone biosynthesis C-methylase UbiE